MSSREGKGQDLAILYNGVDLMRQVPCFGIVKVIVVPVCLDFRTGAR